MKNQDSQIQVSIQQVNYRTITPDWIMDQYNKASTQGSNPDLSIYEVEFNYFIDANTILLGGGVKPIRGESFKGNNIKLTKNRNM